MATDKNKIPTGTAGYGTAGYGGEDPLKKFKGYDPRQAGRLGYDRLGFPVRDERSIYGDNSLSPDQIVGLRNDFYNALEPAQGQSVGDPATQFGSDRVERKGNLEYYYDQNGDLRGVVQLDEGKQREGYATFQAKVAADEVLRQQQMAAAAAYEARMKPLRDMAASLIEQLGSGSYAANEKALRGRLAKMTKGARKGITKGYDALEGMISGQVNPFANLQATQVEAPAQLAALLAQQGAGSNLLEQEIAAQQMANAGAGGAFTDLVQQLAAAYSAGQQGSLSEAALQERYAKDILADRRNTYNTELAARSTQKRGDIEAQLAELGAAGVALPENWQTLADRGAALRRMSKLSPQAQKYLRGLVGA